MQPLYQIKNEYLQALNELENMEGLTPDIIQDSLGAIDAQFEEKALAVAAYIKNLELDYEILKEYRTAMGLRHIKLARKIDGLKDYLKINMQALEKKSIKGIEFDVGIKASQHRVVIDDESQIGQEWYHHETITTLDKEALRNALATGKEIAGVHLEQGVSLTIK